MNSFSDYLGPLGALGSSVTWAVGSAGYSKLTQDHSPFTVNFTRALVAMPLFLIMAFISAGGWSEGLASFSQVTLTHWGWFTLSMTASYGLGDTLFLWSTRYLGVPGALAIAACYPIWTVVAGYLFAGEAVTLNRILGILITLIGIVVVILNIPQPSGTKKSSQKISWIGILLALTTSIAWATNAFATARGGSSLGAPVGNTIRMIMAMVLSATFGRILARGTPVAMPVQQIKHSLPLFVFEAFLGSYFYMYGMSHTPLALASILASLSPVISVPIALFLKLEKFSIWRTGGVALVVFGIWFLLSTF